MECEKLKIEVLPSARLFDEREYGLIHTPYELETAFYSQIGAGNVNGLKEMLPVIMKSGIVAGKMSSNSIRQMQYWAVCCVAIATRYAIAGGVNETSAYNFSDECIMKIDLMQNETDILDFLFKKSIELAEAVKLNKTKGYPKVVRKCLQIINTRLFDSLSVKYLALECGISKDHLSLLFKKYVGMGIPRYIKKERLEASKSLLNTGMSISQVAYTVGFNNESYFVKCFKDEFGITPGKFAC